MNQRSGSEQPAQAKEAAGDCKAKGLANVGDSIPFLHYRDGVLCALFARHVIARRRGIERRRLGLHRLDQRERGNQRRGGGLSWPRCLSWPRKEGPPPPAVVSVVPLSLSHGT